MASLMGIHCPFDVPFISRGGDVLVVSRSQLRLLPRKLTFCQAKLGQTSFSQCGWRRDAKRLKAVSQVSEAEVGPSSGSLPPHVLYLLDLGLDLEQIEAITRRDPYFEYYTLEGNIRPLIEFLIDLGVRKSDIPNIVVNCPRFCGLSLTEVLIPTIVLLETLGVAKRTWAKMISRYPNLLNYSQGKIKATLEFFYEAGVSEEIIGKILPRNPRILSCSLENKLRPSAKYFQSLGVDISVLLRHCPETMAQSIDGKLKPVTEFFLQNGFSIKEVGTMISKCPSLYRYSLKSNLVPKWEFFLTMDDDYSRQDLLTFPQYFGYSLEERIKPRYSLIKEFGVTFSLSLLLSRDDNKFEALLRNKIEKL